MGNNSVPKFIFRLSRFPLYRGSALGRFYCNRKFWRKCIQITKKYFIFQPWEICKTNAATKVTNICGTWHCQGRIKLFGAPRQWKHSRPLFKAVFLWGGLYPPDWFKHHASQSQDRNNKYFILYNEFVAADLLFRLARMRHAWKGDCYLTVLVFSWQILFLLS